MNGKIGKAQNNYRKQKSCTQPMVRLCNSIIEAKVLVVVNFESCYGRIWRAGLLHKASNKGINERLLLYIKNLNNDRK